MNISNMTEKELRQYRGLLAQKAVQNMNYDARTKVLEEFIVIDNRLFKKYHKQNLT